MTYCLRSWLVHLQCTMNAETVERAPSVGRNLNRTQEKKLAGPQQGSNFRFGRKKNSWAKKMHKASLPGTTVADHAEAGPALLLKKRWRGGGWGCRENGVKRMHSM